MPPTPPMSAAADSPPSSDQEHSSDSEIIDSSYYSAQSDSADAASSSGLDAQSEIQYLSTRFIDALSSTGSLYGILWPVVIEQATSKQRHECLQHVNEFFASVCLEMARKEDTYMAKREYHSKSPFACLMRERRPVSLDLSVLNGVHWASWGAKRLDFEEVEIFREFCALGDVDPDAGGYQYEADTLPLGNRGHSPRLSWVFVSRTRDIIFETGKHNPNHDAYAHYFGITARADKVKRMYDYVDEMTGNRAGACTADYLEWGTRPAI